MGRGAASYMGHCASKAGGCVWGRCWCCVKRCYQCATCIGCCCVGSAHSSLFLADDAEVNAVEDLGMPHLTEELLDVELASLVTGDLLLMHCTHAFGCVAQAL